MPNLLWKNWKLRVWSFFHFHHVICKILNFDVWTRKHLAQASCTELTSYKIIANEARWICSTKCRNSSWVPKIALNLKDSLIATLKLISKGRYTTPSIPEIIWVKNVRAIVVCGFLMKSLKKHILKIWKKLWVPFGRYLLNSKANPAHFHSNWAELAVLFNR